MKNFKSVNYVNSTLKRLIFEFGEAAYAGTPGLIGSAREHPARKYLERILPGTSAVGSGIVIDSYNGLSKQQDIIIYERDFCPVFTINDSSESTYYPCEGVIAVGEVKSDLGVKELEDAFEKIASAKRLKRHRIQDNVPFRRYGSANTIETHEVEFEPEKKELDQIFGFILCDNFALKNETLLKKISELWKKYQPNERPKVIISLNSGFLYFGNNIDERMLSNSKIAVKNVIFCDDSEEGFLLLIRRLRELVVSGRTVDAKELNRYFEGKSSKGLKYIQKSL